MDQESKLLSFLGLEKHFSVNTEKIQKFHLLFFFNIQHSSWLSSHSHLILVIPDTFGAENKARKGIILEFYI